MEVKALRLSLSLTQTQAASIVNASLRAWQHWETGDRKMSPAIYELFNLKIVNK